MYSGYGAAAAFAAHALRSRPSLCPSYGSVLADPAPDYGAGEVAVNGLSINARFLLYDYYLRQSSLIYWSPARTLLACRRPCHTQYSRLALRGQGGFGSSCPPRRLAREKCSSCCCCCRCRSSGGNFGEEVIELLARSGGHCHGGFEVHCSRSGGDYCDDDNDRFERPKKSWRKEVGIRDGNRIKERYLRERRGGSSWTCHSCGSRHRESKGRSRDYEEIDNFEEEEEYDDASSDVNMELDYRQRDDNVKASSSRRRVCERKGRHKDSGYANSAYRSREDYDSEEEDIIQRRKRKEGSQRIADIYEDDVKKISRSEYAVSSRMGDREKGSTSSVKQHKEVDQQAVGRDECKVEKRETRGASSRVSDHRAREEYDYERHNVVARRDSREGSEKLVKLLDVYEDDLKSSISNKVDKRKVEREENSMLTAKRHNQVDQEVIRSADLRMHHREEHISDEDRLLKQKESRDESYKSTRTSEVHVNDVTRISRINNIIDSRKVNREETSTSSLKRHSEVDEQTGRSSQSRLSLQKHSDILEVDNRKVENTLDTKRHYEETTLNNKKDDYTSVKVAIDDRTHVDQQEVGTLELDKQCSSHTRISGINVSGNAIASSSQGLLQTRLNDQKDDSTSTFGLTHESMVQGNLTDTKSTHESSSRKESKRYTASSELSRVDAKRISNTQSIDNTRVKDELSDHKSLTGESEIDARIFDYSRSDTQNDLNVEVISNRQRKTDKGSSSSIKTGKKDMQKIHYEEGSQINSSELALIGISDDQNSGRMTIKGDMLESATELEKASAVFIGEFVDKVQQETSSSEILKNQGEELHAGIPDTSAIMTSGYPVAGHSLEEDARKSSSQSKTEGPSDEIWDVRSPTSQETSQVEPPEEEASSPGIFETKASTSATESISTHRSPRSLWALLADIIRVGWGHRPGSHSVTRKSGKRSSSTDSVGSEAWFSGQEQDASEDETDKPSRNTSKEPLPVKGPVDKVQGRSSSSLGQTSSVTPKVEGEIIKTEGTTMSPSVDMLQGGIVSTGAPSMGMIQGGSLSAATPSMGMIQGGSAPTAASTGFRLEGNVRIDTGQTAGRVLSSVMSPGKSPVSVGASLVSAQEAIVAGDGPISVTGFKKMEEDIITEESPEAEKIDGKEGELKRRKFQRNQQVLKERFDEWEEAFRIESEQREIDEHFMREALAEAQKAADTWEVPVGAVLVHDGKIIARGFNLVEELRDSTAHAEMICIREASNLLRTWRLAGTTLYVTLEPCPMCAGAILQARVDTVVWGAPNKLLGADGSWVRLFPGGNGGSSSLDPSDQMAGPIHPFHPKITIRRGILATECSEVMQQFFRLRRKKEKKRESTPPSCLPVPTYPIKFFTKMHNAFSVMFCLY